MQPRNALSRIGLLLLCLAPTAQALQPGDGERRSGDWSLEQLMAELAQQRNEAGEARFTEIKTLASVTQPLLAEGVLRYRYPSSLEKEVHKPRAERYVISGDSMAVYRDGKLRRQVQLDDYPAMRSFVGSFMATLGGDLEALRQHYDLQLQGSRADWTLQLTPAGEELQHVVKRIVVQGEGGSIQSFETLQPNDDRSLMLISPLG